MKCPRCATQLQRTRYEGLPVFHCTSCNGYAVSSAQRLDAIKRRREANYGDLEQEAEQAAGSDSIDAIRCPSCNAKMDKEKQEEHSFLFDVCGNCKMVWLDPGEIALLQIDHQSSAQGVESTRFQARLKNMSDSDKEAFEERLSKLPEGDVTGLGGITAGISAVLFDFFRRD